MVMNVVYLFNKNLNFPAFWENEVLLKTVLFIYFFILFINP